MLASNRRPSMWSRKTKSQIRSKRIPRAIGSNLVLEKLPKRRMKSSRLWSEQQIAWIQKMSKEISLMRMLILGKRSLVFSQRRKSSMVYSFKARRRSFRWSFKRSRSLGCRHACSSVLSGSIVTTRSWKRSGKASWMSKKSKSTARIRMSRILRRSLSCRTKHRCAHRSSWTLHKDWGTKKL